MYSIGIKKGVVAVPSRFTVDTKNAGPGDLSVAVEGPSKVDIDCVDNGDGTCEVTYVPVEAGSFFCICFSKYLSPFKWNFISLMFVSGGVLNSYPFNMILQYACAMYRRVHTLQIYTSGKCNVSVIKYS